MSDKIFYAIAYVIVGCGVFAMLSLPFVVKEEIQVRKQFEAACAAKGGTAVELRYDRICLPAGTVIPVGVE